MTRHFTESAEFEEMLDLAIEAIKNRKDSNSVLESSNVEQRTLLNKKAVRTSLEKEIKRDIIENDFFKFNLTDDKKADLKKLIDIVSWKMERMPFDFEG